MGQLKDQALESEDTKIHELNDGELGYLRLLNMTLQYHTLAQKIFSGFLYYVCVTRLGYIEGSSLQFQIDLNQEKPSLSVTLLPADFKPPGGNQLESEATK